MASPMVSKMFFGLSSSSSSSSFTGGSTSVTGSSASGPVGMRSFCLRETVGEVIPLARIMASLDTPYFLAMEPRSSNHLTVWMIYSGDWGTGAATEVLSAAAGLSASGAGAAASSCAAGRLSTTGIIRIW